MKGRAKASQDLTRVLLTTFAHRLRREIAVADKELGAHIARVDVPVYNGPDPLPFLARSDNPEYWSTRPGLPVVLGGFDDLATELEHAASELTTDA